MWHHKLVQLLSVGLYNRDGRIRSVNFRPGRLNIVTGTSRTGKSALLDIVDFCLGRDDAPIPQTKIFRPIAWYGTLWEFEDQSRVFLGRPTFKPGKSSTTQAMLLVGGRDLDLPSFEELEPNTDSNSMRDQIDSRLGMEDSRLSPPEGSTRSPYKVGLGQAAIFLFQTQSEVASKSSLFHRQGEDRMRDSIRDSLPFFLGAVAGDHAEKHQQLRMARRQLRRAEIALEAARAEATEHDTVIQGLLAEAYASGLTEVDRAPSTDIAVRLLQAAVDASPTAAAVSTDLDVQDRRTKLKNERLALRTDLGRLLDERAALIDSSTTDNGYKTAIGQQVQRLRSVNLLPPASGPADTCPACNQALAASDPTTQQLTNRLYSLAAELENMAAVTPGRQKALTEISDHVKDIRERLISVESAIDADESSSSEAGSIIDIGRTNFVRGRIDAVVGRLSHLQGSSLPALHEAVGSANSRVVALERELDDYVARERLTSALISLGRQMTSIAQHLELENSEEAVRLDIAKLTVVTDTPTGPVQLSGLGSGANWLGYHLATHLALHRTFVGEKRPLPRFLMLDQPTQVFYESKSSAERDAISQSGRPADEDHESVTRMFKLLHDFVEDLSPQFQIIVSDHAHLTEDWFEEAVEHNWRGEALVPSEWIGE